MDRENIKLKLFEGHNAVDMANKFISQPICEFGDVRFINDNRHLSILVIYSEDLEADKSGREKATRDAEQAREKEKRKLIDDAKKAADQAAKDAEELAEKIEAEEEAEKKRKAAAESAKDDS